MNYFARLWHEIASRPDGPMAFRFYLQPFMALLVAFNDGKADARAGRPPYFWAMFHDPSHCRELIRNGWHSIAKIFFMALVIDTIYQLVVLHGLRPVQGLIVAVILAIVPYVLTRGPFNRLFSRHRTLTAR
jgi:hypothetical protein